MATTSSCMVVEQKRDFDLSIVLSALLDSFPDSLCKRDLRHLNKDVEVTSHSTDKIADSIVDVISRNTNFTTTSIATSNTAVSQLPSDADIAHGRDATSNDEELTLQVARRELKIREYLDAFSELTRFFKLTGPVFSFVARDLSNKIASILGHLNSTNSDRYTTLRSMIEFDSTNNLVHNKGSATRTFLRLHWALEFIIEFMNQLTTTSHDTKTSKLVFDIYKKTLSHHHPWWTRKLAYLAVHTLPSIRQLIDIMCKHDFDEVQKLLYQIVRIGCPILHYTRLIYDEYGLSEIP